MGKGFDCAVSTAGKGPQIKASGIDYVARYYPTGMPKSLTRQEAEELKRAGLWIVSIYETTAQAMLGGAAAGKGDAERALASARACGQPAGTAIYFACDFDATPDQLPGILAYCQAAHSVLKAAGYLLGIYGSGRVCAAVKGGGWAHYAWLAMSRGWAGSREYGDWDLCQTVEGRIAGIDADGDASKGNAGGWQPE